MCENKIGVWWLVEVWHWFYEWDAGDLLHDFMAFSRPMSIFYQFSDHKKYCKFQIEERKAFQSMLSNFLNYFFSVDLLAPIYGVFSKCLLCIHCELSTITTLQVIARNGKCINNFSFSLPSSRWIEIWNNYKTILNENFLAEWKDANK